MRGSASCELELNDMTIYLHTVRLKGFCNSGRPLRVLLQNSAGRFYSNKRFTVFFIKCDKMHWYVRYLIHCINQRQYSLGFYLRKSVSTAFQKHFFFLNSSYYRKCEGASCSVGRGLHLVRYIQCIFITKVCALSPTTRSFSILKMVHQGLESGPGWQIIWIYVVYGD